MIGTAPVMAGARVMIVSRDGDGCAEVASEINALGHGARAEGLAGDVADAAAIEVVCAAVGARSEALHILVKNAGVS